MQCAVLGIACSRKSMQNSNYKDKSIDQNLLLYKRRCKYDQQVERYNVLKRLDWKYI